MAVLGLLMAACGPPQHTYIANNELGTYLRLPHQWETFQSDEVSEWREDALRDRIPDLEGLHRPPLDRGVRRP